MNRRKFLKYSAVLSLVPVVGMSQENDSFPLSVEFDFESMTDLIDSFGIRNNTKHSSTPSQFVTSWDVNSMYMHHHRKIL